MGCNMILDTLAEAFQGEHDVSGSHTVSVSQAKEALVKSEEQEGDTDVETALAALAQESDTDLEETDVQEMCESIVYRHGAILLIVSECNGSNPRR